MLLPATASSVIKVGRSQKMQFSDEQVEIFDKEDMDAKNLHF